MPPRVSAAAGHRIEARLRVACSTIGVSTSAGSRLGTVVRMIGRHSPVLDRFRSSKLRRDRPKQNRTEEHTNLAVEPRYTSILAQKSNNKRICRAWLRDCSGVEQSRSRQKGSGICRLCGPFWFCRYLYRDISRVPLCSNWTCAPTGNRVDVIYVYQWRTRCEWRTYYILNSELAEFFIFLKVSLYSLNSVERDWLNSLSSEREFLLHERKYDTWKLLVPRQVSEDLNGILWHQRVNCWLITREFQWSFAYNSAWSCNSPSLFSHRRNSEALVLFCFFFLSKIS